MNRKDFEKLLDRDKYCLHCGESEAIAPNHRANRGMGGSKLRGNTANLVILCSELNGLIESDSWHRSQAIKYGWKVASWDKPENIPVFDGVAGVWYLLDNDYGRIVAKRP